MIIMRTKITEEVKEAFVIGSISLLISVVLILLLREKAILAIAPALATLIYAFISNLKVEKAAALFIIYYFTWLIINIILFRGLPGLYYKLTGLPFLKLFIADYAIFIISAYLAIKGVEYLESKKVI